MRRRLRSTICQAIIEGATSRSRKGQAAYPRAGRLVRMMGHGWHLWGGERRGACLSHVVVACQDASAPQLWPVVLHVFQSPLVVMPSVDIHVIQRPVFEVLHARGCVVTAHFDLAHEGLHLLHGLSIKQVLASLVDVCHVLVVFLRCPKIHEPIFLRGFPILEGSECEASGLHPKLHSDPEAFLLHDLAEFRAGLYRPYGLLWSWAFAMALQLLAQCGGNAKSSCQEHEGPEQNTHRAKARPPCSSLEASRPPGPRDGGSIGERGGVSPACGDKSQRERLGAQSGGK